MQMTPKFRILPVLILVAMMAFSVRLVDFALGVSSLSGAAFASAEEKTPDESILAKAGEDHAESDEKMPEKEAKTETKEEGASPDWRDAHDDEIEYSNISREVFTDLSNRRKKLDKQEKELMTREALIRAAEQEIDRKFQELLNLRTEIEGLLQRQSTEEQARFASLVKIYEGMKPKEAARIFDTLDLDVLIAVMSKMSERRLSPILASMNPERARTITIMLAEEKQLPSLPGRN